ncbi:GIY-YIG nuclease family protein [Bradyrhizobium sp. USDA 10063]
MTAESNSAPRNSLIQAYGLFWRVDEINWSPGKGRHDWHLYGRNGAQASKIKVADFRTQKGIYILYGNYGPHYVGLTRKKGLGRRLKDHLFDQHKGQWDRFSWFGFCTVLKAKDENGLQRIREMPLSKITDINSTIGDMEALLIRAMALRNVNHMKFRNAVEWTQVKLDELDKYGRRIND